MSERDTKTERERKKREREREKLRNDSQQISSCLSQDELGFSFILRNKK
jgi:hypothetical protein